MSTDFVPSANYLDQERGRTDADSRRDTLNLIHASAEPEGPKLGIFPFSVECEVEDALDKGSGKRCEPEADGGHECVERGECEVESNEVWLARIEVSEVERGDGESTEIKSEWHSEAGGRAGRSRGNVGHRKKWGCERTSDLGLLVNEMKSTI